MAKKYSLGGFAGKIHETTNPHTGTRVSVYHSDQAGMDSSDGAKYHAVCEEHSMTMPASSIAGAKSAAIDSPSWCDDCRELETEKLKRKQQHFDEGQSTARN
jgi:hypothetical protein